MNNAYINPNLKNINQQPYNTSTGIPNITPQTINVGDLPMEQSYIENILRLNKGKKVRVHQTFPDSNEWRDIEFKGIIEQSGRDHIILSIPETGVWQVLLMIYVDYISFDEPINYIMEF